MLLSESGAAAHNRTLRAARHAPVTVVVPTYNRAAFLRRSLDSLLGQDWPPERVICVDDGSSDDTAAVVASYGKRVLYLRKENGGKSSALNLALPLLQSEFAWFFDDDDHAYPWATSALLDALLEDRTLDFSYGTSDIGRSSDDGGIEFVRRREYPVLRESMEVQRAYLLRFSFFTLCGCIVRTSSLRSAGCFREELIRSQDYDFLVRLTMRGRFRYVGRSVFLCRFHGGVRGTASERIASGRVQQAWRTFDQVIGRELLATLALDDFRRELPDLAVADADLQGVPPARFARITRAWVLATKSMLDAVVDDLVDALGTDDEIALSRTERERLLALMNHHYFAGAACERMKPLLRLCVLQRTANGRKALLLFARALYWQARGANRPKEKAALLALALTYRSAAIRMPRWSLGHSRRTA